MMRIRCFVRSLSVLLNLVLVAGCNTPGTKPQLADSSFKEENTPLRMMRVVLFTENDNGEGEQMIRDVSDFIEPQVGIQYSLIKKIVVKQGFRGLGKSQALKRLYDLLVKNDLELGTDFDIAIGIASRSFFGRVATLIPIPTWYAVIDDALCRCLIITKETDARVVGHELMHVHILDGKHHRGGLMGATQSILTRGLYLLPEDRKEVLKNKWRKMSHLTDEQKAHIRAQKKRKKNK